MTKKYKRKRPTSSMMKSVLITTLLVSVAFLLGLLVERNTVSFQWVKSYAREVSSQIGSISSYFEEDKDSHMADFFFFDVGQGSAVLLKAFDGTTILLDTGRYNDSDAQIINYLNEEIGIGGEIDLLIFTHNDADHIGNGDLVLDYFQVNEVWMNGMDHTSQSYSEVLDALLESEAEYLEPKRGYSTEVGAFSIDVLHPFENEKQDSQNNESIVTRIMIGETALIHSGDVNKNVESLILDKYSGTLRSDIMVLGHHGSSTSTSERWLSEIVPKVAIYQAGIDNHYGHPHEEILQSFDDHPAELLGTDNYGTIQLIIDENNQIVILAEEED